MSELTEEAKKEILERVKNEWYKLIFESGKIPDEKEIRPLMDRLYELSGEKPPRKIKIFLSLIDEKIAIHNVLRKRKKYQQYKGEFLYLSSYQGGGWDAAWLAKLEAAEQMGFKPSKELFFVYKDLVKKGVYDFVPDRDVYVCAYPKKIRMDDRMRLHSTNGPAVEWHNHRGDLYFIHGALFPEDLYWRVVKREISAEEVLKIENIEVRTRAIEILGYERMLRELDAKELEKRTTTSRPPLNVPITYALYEVQLNDDQQDGENLPAKILQVQCPSTSKITFIRVPPFLTQARGRDRKPLKTIDDALTAMFQLNNEINPEEYFNSLLAET